MKNYTMKIHDDSSGRFCFSEKFKRSMVNRMAHHLAQRQISVYRDELQIDLDQAEMRGRDAVLMSKWLIQLNTRVEHRADACMC